MDVCESVDFSERGFPTIEEFFEYYVFDSDRTGLADSVKKSNYDCMRDEPEDVDAD